MTARASTGFEEETLRRDLLDWLAAADLQKSGKARKCVQQMYRIMIGADEGKQAAIVAALEAVDARLPIILPGGPRTVRELAMKDPSAAGIAYVNGLKMKGWAEHRPRLTNERAARIVQLVAQGPGRVKGRKSDKIGDLAQALTDLLGFEVQESMVRKCLKLRSA